MSGVHSASLSPTPLSTQTCPSDPSLNTSPSSVNYASRFSDLSKKPSDNLVAKIKTLIIQLLVSIFGPRELNFDVHMNAEHMGRGHLGGNNSQEVVNKVCELLTKVEGPSNEKATTLRKLLVNCAGDLKVLEKETDISALTAKKKHEIKNLNQGEQVALTSNSETHAMIMLITCTRVNADGTKIYKVTQHNEGSGINAFHYSKVNEEGQRLFQTAFEITDVPGENLYTSDWGFIDEVWDQDQTSAGVEALYREIIPILKGKIAPPSDDPRLWSPGQIGRSCSSRCLLSLLRAEMSVEEFSHFSDVAKYEMLLKTFTQIKNGWENRTVAKVLALEVIKELSESKGMQMPFDLSGMKEQLEDQLEQAKPEHIRREADEELTYEHIAQDIEANINTGFPNSLNTNDKFEIEKSFSFFKATLALAEEEKKGNFAKMSAADYETFIDRAHLLLKRAGDVPLSREQVYILTALASIVLKKIEVQGTQEGVNDQKEFKEDEEKTKSFCKNIHRRFNALNLNSYFPNADFSELINGYQSKFYIKNSGVQAPKGLAEVSQRMSSPTNEWLAPWKRGNNH